jgi:predicted MFS family arabinose efflux permease
MRGTLKSIDLGLGKSSIIFPSAFLVAAGISIVELGIVFYVKEVFDASPSQVGYFIALWSVTYIFGCLFIRPLFNRILPRHLLIASSFLMGLFVTAVTLTSSFTLGWVYYNLYGLAMSFFWPPIMGWLSRDAEGAQLGRSMSYFNLSWGSGLIVGPPLAGVMSARAAGLPLHAGGLLFCATGVLILTGSTTLPLIRSDRGVDSSGAHQREGEDRSTVLRFSGWIGVFTTFVVIGMIVSIFPLFARDVLGLRKEIIGFLMQSRTFLATFVFVFLAHTSFWHFKILPMIAGQSCLAFIVFLLGSSTSPAVLAALIALVGACRALSYNTGIFHGVSGSVNRAGRMAIHEALLASGLVVGSSLGGVVYQRFSMTAVYLMCASIVLLGAALQLVLYLWLRSHEPSFTTRP